MMLIVLLAILIFAAALAATRRGSETSLPSLPPPMAPRRDVALDDESVADLSLRDPVQAVLLYGTPGDATRLADQGVDLSALGYRPPEGH